MTDERCAAPVDFAWSVLAKQPDINQSRIMSISHNDSQDPFLGDDVAVLAKVERRGAGATPSKKKSRRWRGGRRDDSALTAAHGRPCVARVFHTASVLRVESWQHDITEDQKLRIMAKIRARVPSINDEIPVTQFSASMPIQAVPPRTSLSGPSRTRESANGECSKHQPLTRRSRPSQ